MSQQAERPSGRAKSMPVLAIISACLVAALSPTALGLLTEIAANHEVSFNELTLFILDHRWWMIAAMLPAVLLAVAALFTSSSAVRIVLAAASGLWLAAGFAIVFYAAINVIGPLYTYQAL